VVDVAKARGIELPDDLEIIDPDTIRDQYVTNGRITQRQTKRITSQRATSRYGSSWHDDVALDQVDGLVSGAIHHSQYCSSCISLIKTPEYSLVSSIFFMLLPDEVYVYGDCAINPDPDAQQLAEIAIQSADSAKALVLNHVLP
jgi:phosphate acetyltransferase